MTERSHSQAAELGRVIQMRRAEMGMKRKELAASSGLSYPYVSEIENGHKEPSNRALRMLAEALELPPSRLLELAGRLGEERSDGSVLLDTESQWDVRRHSQGERGLLAMASMTSPDEWSTASSDQWLESLVRNVVRAELQRWAQRELPVLLRTELGRIMNDRESE